MIYFIRRLKFKIKFKYLKNNFKNRLELNFRNDG